MIKGMTGFGSAQFSQGKVKGMVEIKSVNHRYFDISYYLPIGFSSLEEKIRLKIQKEVERGRVTISLKITHKPSTLISVNKDAIKQYFKHANQLKKDFNFKNDLTLSDIVKLPGVLEVKETVLDPESLWPTVEACLKKALAGFVHMRKREGKSLVADVNSQLTKMIYQLNQIKSRAVNILKMRKKELTNEDFSSFQKSTDVNEEIARLTHYIEELKVLLKNGGTIGKNIDFIAQEMQRETNTIGSKFQDKVISNSVIALKGKIEKIREQSQNIE